MNQAVLEEFGLTSAEAKIYLVLLEQGASLAGTISRNTGIHRRSVYDCIERLIQKGLVSYIKSNNRKYFEAAGPERLIEILKKKEDDINQALPELKLLQTMSQEKKETLFFRGKTGLKTAFDDQLSSDEILVLGATMRSAEIVPYYFPHYDRQRVRKKLKCRMIFNETEKEDPQLRKIPLAEFRFLPKDVQSNTSIYIYGRNICIVEWKADPIAILIREESIAQGFRNYFSFMWQVAKR